MNLESICYDEAWQRASAQFAQFAAQNRPAALVMLKNSLNGGEMAPDLGARFDQQRYQSGCASLLNMIPLAGGGITKRPGFEFLANSIMARYDESGYTATRLIPFVFSATQARMLEFFSDNDEGCALRVWFPNGQTISNAPETDVIRLDGLSRGVIGEMTYAQSGDVLFLAHRDIPPMKLCRYADDDWRLEKIEWLPSLAAPTITRGEVVGNIPSGENSRMTQRYVATAIDAITGEESLPCPAFEVSGVPPLSQTLCVQIEVAPQEGVSEFRVYKRYAGVYGFIGRIPASGPNSWLVCEDRNIQPDTEDTPPGGQNPFDGPGNYPGVVFLHQQRLGYAASLNRPLTIWMSQSGNFESMAASVPPHDDDAIDVTLAANQANRILWCVSDRDGLALGTEGGEWTLVNGEGGAVSPLSLSFNPQTYYGSKPGLPVLRAGSRLLFVQRGGKVAREFGYSFQDDRYNSADITLLARHIFEDAGGIADWCWQAEPRPIIWAALNDGTLASCSYLPEQEVIAWARHITSGSVENVASIPDENGDWQVWALILRAEPESGAIIRTVERLRPFKMTFPAHFEPDYHTDCYSRLPYDARCQPLLPETSLQNGSTFLRVRKINAIKARVINTAPFKALAGGINTRNTDLMDVPARKAEFLGIAQDWNCPVPAGWRDMANFSLIMDGPGPATILGLTITMEIATEAGGQR